MRGRIVPRSAIVMQQNLKAIALKQKADFTVKSLMDSAKLQNSIIQDHFKNNSFNEFVAPHNIYFKTLEKSIQRAGITQISKHSSGGTLTLVERASTVVIAEKIRTQIILRAH